MSEALVVFTNCPDDGVADRIARSLVEQRLAACVNVLPEMTSYFRWRGAVEQAEERQLVIKTTGASLDALEARLHEIHPYELPEFLVLPVVDGADAYLKWLGDAISD